MGASISHPVLPQAPRGLGCPGLWKLCKLPGLGLCRGCPLPWELGSPPAAVGMAHLAFPQPLPLQGKACAPPCAVSQSVAGAPGNRQEWL